MADRLARQYPNNMDAERAVLGAVLLDNEVIGEVSRFLKVEDFYHPGHQIIYDTMLKLYASSKTVELTLLVDRLRCQGKLDQVGNYVYLANLEQFVISTSAAVEHARLVQEKSILRRLAAAAENILTETSEERYDILDQVERAQKAIYDATGCAGSKRRMQSIDSVVECTVVEAYERAERFRAGISNGTSTGFCDLDKLVGGLEPKTMTILAARPSLGKSAFALDIMRQIGKRGVPCAFNTLEMGNTDLSRRMQCSEGRVSYRRIVRGEASDDELHRFQQAGGAMLGKPMVFAETPGISAVEWLNQARWLKYLWASEGHTEFVFILDGLWLMTHPSNKGWLRTQEIGETTRMLKQGIVELEGSLILVHQLNRNKEHLNPKGDRPPRPSMSDLRDTGAAEQDADDVWLLDRERVDNSRQGWGLEGPPPVPMEIICAKGRNHEIGTCLVEYDLHVQRFFDMTPSMVATYWGEQGRNGSTAKTSGGSPTDWTKAYRNQPLD